MVDKNTFQLCESITEEEALKLDDNYCGNFKFDGCRILAVVKDGKVALLNRRGYSPVNEFAEVVEDLKSMSNCVIDGEVIDYTDTFNKLQRRAGTRDRAKQEQLRKEIPVKYEVFDILLNSQGSLVRLPLRERVDKLKELFQEFNQKFSDRKPCIEMVEYKPIKEMLEQAHSQDREGILVKNWNGIYEGRRTRNWQKCKFFVETTIKVCKYEVNPKGIRAEDKKGNAIQVAGNQSIAVKQAIDTFGEVEVNVQYLEMTKEGRMRFPSFRSIKKDL